MSQVLHLESGSTHDHILSEEQKFTLIAVVAGLIGFHQRWKGWSDAHLKLLCQQLGKPPEEMERELQGEDEALQENIRRLRTSICGEDERYGSVKLIVKACLSTAVQSSEVCYDARARALVRYVTDALGVDWSVAEALEIEVADELINAQLSGQPSIDRMKRVAVVGAATLAGSGLLLVTGGLAAPALVTWAGYSMVTVAGTSGLAVGVGTVGVVSAGVIGYRANRLDSKLGQQKLEGFEFYGLQESDTGLSACIGICGWLEQGENAADQWKGLIEVSNGKVGMYALGWKAESLARLGKPLRWFLATQLASKATTIATNSGIDSTSYDDNFVMTNPSLVSLLGAANFIEAPWWESIALAKEAGDVLADLLANRAHGSRPVTLIGYSIGAKLLFKCLEKLASLGEKGRGIVESAFLLGAPITADQSRWESIREVCGHRLVNVCCKTDWVLHFVFRAAQTKTSIAGLYPVPSSHVENVDVSDIIQGHAQYKTMLPKLIKKLGIRTGQVQQVYATSPPCLYSSVFLGSPQRPRKLSLDSEDDSIVSSHSDPNTPQPDAASHPPSLSLKLGPSDSHQEKLSPMPTRWGKDPPADKAIVAMLPVSDLVLYDEHVDLKDSFPIDSPLFAWMTKAHLLQKKELADACKYLENNDGLSRKSADEPESIFARWFRSIVRQSVDEESAADAVAHHQNQLQAMGDASPSSSSTTTTTTEAVIASTTTTSETSTDAIATTATTAAAAETSTDAIAAAAAATTTTTAETSTDTIATITITDTTEEPIASSTNAVQSDVFLSQESSLSPSTESMGSCEACTLDFKDDVDSLVPRQLKCGHVFCTRCINELIDGGTVICVFRCNAKTVASKVDQVPRFDFNVQKS